MILVPDLATDLGTHNDNYTKWTFTIRPGVKWGENGKPVTAQDVALGMTRCMDAATFPTGACQYYSNAYFKGGATTRACTPTRARSSRASRSTATPSRSTMAKPFPDMPYWGTFPANGPIPRRQGLGPEDLQEPPVVDRSVHDQDLQPVQGAGAGEEPVLGPRDRPGSHAVPRRVRLQAAAASRRRSTRSCSPTPATARPR